MIVRCMFLLLLVFPFVSAAERTLGGAVSDFGSATASLFVAGAGRIQELRLVDTGFRILDQNRELVSFIGFMLLLTILVSAALKTAEFPKDHTPRAVLSILFAFLGTIGLRQLGIDLYSIAIAGVIIGLVIIIKLVKNILYRGTGFFPNLFAYLFAMLLVVALSFLVMGLTGHLKDRGFSIPLVKETSAEAKLLQQGKTISGTIRTEQTNLVKILLDCGVLDDATNKDLIDDTSIDENDIAVMERMLKQKLDTAEKAMRTKPDTVKPEFDKLTACEQTFQAAKQKYLQLLETSRMITAESERRTEESRIRLEFTPLSSQFYAEENKVYVVRVSGKILNNPVKLDLKNTQIIVTGGASGSETELGEAEGLKISTEGNDILVGVTAQEPGDSISISATYIPQIVTQSFNTQVFHSNSPELTGRITTTQLRFDKNTIDPAIEFEFSADASDSDSISVDFSSSFIDCDRIEQITPKKFRCIVKPTEPGQDFSSEILTVEVTRSGVTFQGQVNVHYISNVLTSDDKTRIRNRIAFFKKEIQTLEGTLPYKLVNDPAGAEADQATIKQLQDAIQRQEETLK